MNQNLYRLTYCSRNLIRGHATDVQAEIQQILRVARARNSRQNITGALLYNNGNFAQVLEGPIHSIERTFERIQQDMRHSEVTVVQNGPAEFRHFGDWSMACAGEYRPIPASLTDSVFRDAFAHVPGADQRIIRALELLVSRDPEGALLDDCEPVLYNV